MTKINETEIMTLVHEINKGYLAGDPRGLDRELLNLANVPQDVKIWEVWDGEGSEVAVVYFYTEDHEGDTNTFSLAAGYGFDGFLFDLAVCYDEVGAELDIPLDYFVKKAEGNKYYRSMSAREFQLLTAGCDIVGKRNYKARTTSHGVCFFRGNMSFDSDFDGETVHCNWSPENYGLVLSGLNQYDVMVEFEPAKGTELTESYGIYADPYNLAWDARVCLTEYCIPSYNRDTMIPVRYFVPEKYNPNKGTWYTCN